MSFFSATASKRERKSSIILSIAFFLCPRDASLSKLSNACSPPAHQIASLNVAQPLVSFLVPNPISDPHSIFGSSQHANQVPRRNVSSIQPSLFYFDPLVATISHVPSTSVVNPTSYWSPYDHLAPYSIDGTRKFSTKYSISFFTALLKSSLLEPSLLVIHGGLWRKSMRLRLPINITWTLVPYHPSMNLVGSSLGL